jgi:dienelactone hydrolase
MWNALRLSLALSFSGVLAAAAEPTPGRGVDLKASDGTKLAATYFSSGRPGPGILLLHQCNRDRSSWNGLAAQLAAKGFHVLTLDYRGYGESGGKPYTELTFPEQRQIGAEKWPGDIDVAYACLRSQAGVRGDVIGAGGASCGVNQSIQLSRRHPEVKSLVLLSGNTNREGRQYLRTASALPLFLAAADDDGGAVEMMAWLDATSGNPQNKFVQYGAGGHGTEMFKAHPELPGDIVAWYEATLTGKGAVVSAASRPRPADPTIRLFVMMDEPGGPARAAELLAAERTKNPKAGVLEPGFVNRLGYAALEVEDTHAAVAIMQINVEGHPSSSNAWDSLGDAYLAAGQREKAREAAEKALALVDSDSKETKEQRAFIRQSAQGKLQELKAPAPK